MSRGIVRRFPFVGWFSKISTEPALVLLGFPLTVGSDQG